MNQKVKRRRLLKTVGSVTVASGIGITSASATQTKNGSRNQKDDGISDFAATNNSAEDVDLEIRVYNTNSGKKQEQVSRVDQYLESHAPENRNQARGNVPANATTSGAHRIEIEIPNSRPETETVSFDQSGFPSQEQISIYVTRKNKLRTHHLFA